jgi:hypothetical protein
VEATDDGIIYVVPVPVPVIGATTVSGANISKVIVSDVV